MKTSIFIIENNPMYSMSVGLKLEEMLNCALNFFNTAEEAIANLSYKPAIIIMDYELSGIKGVEAVKKIKEKDPKVRIIVISSHQHVEDAVEIVKAGAYSYIIKDKNTAKKIIDSVMEITEEVF